MMPAVPAKDLLDGLPVTEIFGLPLHPLLVHGAVVLLPLTAVGVIVMFSGLARGKRYGPAVLLVAFLGALFAGLSMLSGKDLARQLDLSGQTHFRYGEYLAWLGLAQFVVVLILVALDKQAKGKRSGFGSLLGVLGVLLGLATIGLTVYVGHLGAQLVWQGTL